jgi:O-antigen ligase
MNELINKNIFWYICLLIPLTYTIGIAITETFVLITILFFIFINRNLNIFKDKKILFLFLFTFYISVNSIFQISYNDLKIQSIFHFRFVILSISIFFILNYFEEKNIPKNYLLKFIIFLILFIIFDSLFQFFVGNNFFGFEIVKNRISGIFGDELILGSFLVRILPIILWVIFFTKCDIKKHKNILYIFFSLYFIVIYLSGERTSLILLIISLLFYFFFLQRIRKIFITSLIILLSFIAITASVDIGKSNPFNRIFVKTFNQVQNKFFIQNDLKIKLNDYDYTTKKKYSEKSKKNKNNNKIFIFSAYHTEHFILAFHLFSQSPIFGKGPGGFRSYCRDVMYDSKIGMCTTHPHNFLMQILAETGLVGFIFYMTGFLFILLKLFQYKKKKVNIYDRSCFIVCSVALLISLFPLLPSGNLFNNWIMIINHYYIGLYLFGYNRLNNQ